MRIAWLVLAVFLAACGAPTRAGDDAQGRLEHGALTLVLDGARASGKPLTAHLRTRDGRVTQAWATTEADNYAHDLDAGGLKIDAGSLKGELVATIGHVAHVCGVDVAASAGSLRGTFAGGLGRSELADVSGTVAGTLGSLPDGAAPTAFDLLLHAALPAPSGAIAQARLTFTMKDGKAIDAAIGSTTNRQPAPHWSGKVEGIDLGFDGAKLSGTVRARVDGGGFIKTGAGLYTMALDAQLAGCAVVGRFRTEFDGRKVGGDRLSGLARPPAESAPDPANCAAVLTLAKAVDGQEPLEVHLAIRKGAIQGATAAAQNLSASGGRAHRVDASGLRLDGKSLKGTLQIAIDAEAWRGGLQRPVAAAVEIDAVLEGDKLAGTFRRQFVVRKTSGAVSGTLASWRDLAGANTFAAGMDFPAWRGPTGNGSCAPSGHRLVDTLAQARLVWQSEQKLPMSWIWSGDATGGIVGGYCTPIVADERVYVFHYEPSGDFIVEPADIRARDRERCRDKYRVDADDVFVCIDARTGRTLWRTAFAGRGINYNRSGGSGPFMTPCVADGKLYGIGSAGRVYCVDARTGATVWESSAGAGADKVEAMRRQCRKDRTMPEMRMDFCSAPCVVDGVVVCNDNEKGLVGLDAATGKKLWGPIPDCTVKSSSPVRWMHEGKPYIIIAAHRALCIEPRTAKVVWEAPGVAHQGTVAVTDQYMVCSGGDKRILDKIEGGAGLCAYRIDLSGAKLAWDLGPKYNNHVTSPVIWNGHVYAFWEPATICVELATGKIVGSSEFPGVRSCSSLLAADGRVLREHLYRQIYWYDADPKNFRQLGPAWLPPGHAENTTSTIVDGRLFMRGRETLWCYDLRSAAP